MTCDLLAVEGQLLKHDELVAAKALAVNGELDDLGAVRLLRREGDGCSDGLCEEALAVHVLAMSSATTSVLKTSRRANHASSKSLFIWLHSHDGVNTSARLLVRWDCFSCSLAMRGLITPEFMPVIFSTVFSSSPI